MSNAIRIRQTQERLIAPSGLMLVGALIKRTALSQRINRLEASKGVKHQNANCVIPYVGLLCQGKTEYEDIRELQEDARFYCQALHITSIPSSETVRQRMDSIGFDIAATTMVMEESVNMLKSTSMKPSPTFTGHVPLDVDVSVHDNSHTNKEGVERTYKGVDGYAPIYAYIGEEGYICNVELREGSSHSQCEGTVEYLKDTLVLAKSLTNERLLVRMDSGNDALDNIKLFISEQTDYLIKRNIRAESKDEWLETAKLNGTSAQPRDGKTVYTGSVYRDRGLDEPIRIVYEVTERTMAANGQLYIIPDIEVNTWWTSLTHSESDIIRSYKDHATCEQFHSEIKSDIGLERFPSGKFDTNAAILKLAALSYNILRIIGQNALHGVDKLTRHDVKRLRAKTVIQRLMFIAGHVIQHARQTIITFGRSNVWRHSFTRLCALFC
jgi:hypothetical protein